MRRVVQAGGVSLMMCLRWRIHAWLISVGNRPRQQLQPRRLYGRRFTAGERTPAPVIPASHPPQSHPLNPLHAWMLMVFVRLLLTPGDN